MDTEQYQAIVIEHLATTQASLRAHTNKLAFLNVTVLVLLAMVSALFAVHLVW